MAHDALPEPQLGDVVNVTRVGAASKVEGSRVSDVQATVKFVGSVPESGEPEFTWYGLELAGNTVTGNTDGRWDNKGMRYHFRTRDGRTRGIFVLRDQITASGLQHLTLGETCKQQGTYKNQGLIDKVKIIYGEPVPSSSIFADGAVVTTSDGRKGTVQTSTELDNPKKYQVVWYDEDGDMDFEWFTADQLQLDGDAKFQLTQEEVKNWTTMDVSQWTYALPDPHCRVKYTNAFMNADINGLGLLNMTWGRIKQIFPQDHKEHQQLLWDHCQTLQALA